MLDYGYLLASALCLEYDYLFCFANHNNVCRSEASCFFTYFSKNMKIYRFSAGFARKHLFQHFRLDQIRLRIREALHQVMIG
jgi:hypothetical protein